MPLYFFKARAIALIPFKIVVFFRFFDEKYKFKDYRLVYLLPINQIFSKSGQLRLLIQKLVVH